MAGALLLGSCAARGGVVDPRGPVDYPGMKVVVNAAGVQAPGYVFTNGCAKPTPWQARWIGLAGDSRAPVELFRREVVLTEAPTKVAAWLTADMKYRLYINGRLVARGPVDMGRDYQGGSTERWFYDYRDLTPYFTPGTNVVAAEVFGQWPAGMVVSRGQRGFLFEAEVTLADQPAMVVKSDASWRALPAAQFPNVTIYDATQEPPGWRMAGFNDAEWQPARELNSVWPRLVPSELPPLMEARYPVRRLSGLTGHTVTTNSSFTVEFDRVLSAYPTLEVRGGRGARVTIKAHQSATMILDGGDDACEFPFMTEIAPSFTVTFTNVTSPVEILDVGANFTSQPLAYEGSFACSDEYLNRLWEVSRWAVQICLQTHHLDSPNHQEPICDPGDYVIESMVNHYAFGQPWLARQDLRKFAWLLENEHYHNFHTSYSLAWLQMLLDYYDYTGDQSLVVELSPYVQALLDTYTGWRGTNGIISQAPNYMFMDWVSIGGFPCHHPPAVIGQGYLTALYYHGLEMAARVAAITGDQARVAHYDQLRHEVLAAFNRELWVPDRGLYRDGKPFQTTVKPGQWLPADKDIETFSPHVNLLAVLFDLAPHENQSGIVAKVLAEKPLNTQPWFMHWVLAAVDHAGLFDQYATEQLHRWQIVPETQSFREMWHQGDLSHGWCSTPLVQLSARVLGVTPATPGFKVIAIRPELGDLRWAKGVVPTPQGKVSVDWALNDGQWQMHILVPPGSEAEVTLPVARFADARPTLDGSPVAPVMRVASGAHEFKITGKLKAVPTQ